MTYSVFDDPKLFKKPDTRNWNPKTGNGWRRNASGDWQYYSDWKPVKGKVDKSGVKDVFNLGEHGWDILPTKKVAPIPQRPHNWFSIPSTSNKTAENTVNNTKDKLGNGRSLAETNARSSQSQAQNQALRTAELVLPGTGSKYNADGTEIKLGVGWGEPGSRPIEVEPGRTRWVGLNSTWTDRYGNVIAPRVDPTAVDTTTTTESQKAKTKNSGVNPNNTTSTSLKTSEVDYTLPENNRFLRMDNFDYNQQMDLINQGLVQTPKGTESWTKHDGQIFTGLGERLGFDEPGSGLKAWQAQQKIQLDAAKKANDAVTLDNRIQGAASSAAMAGIKMMINKIMEPKKGTDGAYEGGGAISGGGKKPWEEMYIPQWYA